MGQEVIVVSGLPRSGTSAMMRCLGWGGLPLCVDTTRPADIGNPHGYFEDSRVKRLRVENSWVNEAKGKGLKVVSPLLPFLPFELRYRVIFMCRDAQKILDSQQRLISHLRGTELRGKEAHLSPEEIDSHISETQAWLRSVDRFAVLYMNFDDLLQDTLGASRRVCDFLEMDLDVMQMVSAVVGPNGESLTSLKG